jgi:hypothetical protein
VPLFSDDEDETPKFAKFVKISMPVSDDERSPSPGVNDRSPSPEVQVVESSSGRKRRGKGGSAVAEMDQTPQDITKHGYPERAFLLNSEIYIGVSLPIS